jgi:hypothetical protein
VGWLESEALDGIIEGTLLGSIDGLFEGLALGFEEDSFAASDWLGSSEGIELGWPGWSDSVKLSSTNGILLGSTDGTPEGLALGLELGILSSGRSFRFVDWFGFLLDGLLGLYDPLGESLGLELGFCEWLGPELGKTEMVSTWTISPLSFVMLPERTPTSSPDSLNFKNASIPAKKP